MGPNGENVGKRILDIDGGQTNKTNNVNSGEEQLIAFGEATVEDVGMGLERNSRTVTFELLQTAFFWFLPCLDLLPVALLFAYVFPGFLVPRCALLFGEYL